VCFAGKTDPVHVKENGQESIKSNSKPNTSFSTMELFAFAGNSEKPTHDIEYQDLLEGF
jgi:hypothetical protein